MFFFFFVEIGQKGYTTKDKLMAYQSYSLVGIRCSSAADARGSKVVPLDEKDVNRMCPNDQQLEEKRIGS